MIRSPREAAASGRVSRVGRVALAGLVAFALLVSAVGSATAVGAGVGATDDGTRAATAGPAVRLAPATANVTVDGTTTVDVIVERAAAGIGSYDLTVSVGDAGVATVTNATAAGDPNRTFVDIDGTNRSVRIDAIGTETADSGPVTAATVVVAGKASGRTSLSVTVDALGDENGTRYAVGSTTGATVNVTAGGGRHASGVPQRVFDAAAGADGTLERTDVIATVRGYVTSQSVGGVAVERVEVLALVRYYVRQS